MKLGNVIIGLFGLLIICLCTSCDSGPTVDNLETTESEYDKLQAELSSQYDTVFSDDYFLRYTLDNNHIIRIVWGNEGFERWIMDEEYPGWAPSEFETKWEDYIGLFHSCGTCPCRTHILLPKNKTDSVQFYNSHYATSPNLNLIFYHNGLSDARSEFRVENIITKQKQIILLDSICGYPTACAIDSSSFDENRLYVKWRNDCMGGSYEGVFEIESEILQH